MFTFIHCSVEKSMAAAETICIHVEDAPVDLDEYDEEEEDDFVAELPGYMKVHQPGKAITSKRGTVRGMESKVANTVAGIRKMNEDRERSEQSARLMRLLEEESPDADGRGGKIVVYTTSLSAIRDTYKECRAVNLMLRGHCVMIQQKDIMLHEEYHKELKERLDDDTVTVPQVFINGHHIGGYVELSDLNESGKLGELLEGFERIFSSDCAACANRGFITCLWCQGSKKSVRNRYGTLRCTVCNENGLQVCPECS